MDRPDPPAFVDIDLHVHSMSSACGYLSAEEIVAHARAGGRRVVAVSDHNTAAGAIAVRDLVDRTGGDLLVLVGMELSTSDAGHVLVYGEGVERDWGWRPGQAMPRHLPDDWVAIKAHPFREVVKHAPPGPLRDDLPDLPGCIDAVERWNGNDLLVKSPDRRGELDAASISYIARQGKVGVAASDAHRATSLHAFYTRFPRPVRSVRDVVDQVKSGQVQPGRVPEDDLEVRRVAWRRRRVVGWYVDKIDWVAAAAACGHDPCEAAETVASFKGVRRLVRAGASPGQVAVDAGLPRSIADDYVAILREESHVPPRVR